MPQIKQYNQPPVTGAIRKGNDTFVVITSSFSGGRWSATYNAIQGDQVTNWSTLITPAVAEVWLLEGVPYPQAVDALHAFKAGRVLPSATSVLRLK